MPEQLALEQRLGQRGAVHRDERLAVPRRQIVDSPGHELLAGPGFALDEHRRGDRGHLLDLDQHLLDRGRFAEDTGALLQATALDEPPHRGRDFAWIDGFLEPSGEAELAADLAGIGVGRLDQAEGRDAVLARGGEEARRAGFVEAAGQDDRIRLPAPHRGSHIVERRDHRGVEARLLQRGVHADGLLEVVGGDENAISHARLASR